MLTFFSQSSAFAQSKFKLKPGDLLFQDLDCGGLCDAIESVTEGYKNSTFSHVGIVLLNAKGEPEVLEAIGDSVHVSPLSNFLKRQLDADQKPKVAVGRLKKKYRALIPAALQEGKKLRGKAYDDVFAMNNDRYYCSELVYEMFTKANNNQPLFPLFPMTYKTPHSNETMEVWIAYFNKLNASIPENEPGLNPGGISRSKVLKVYFPYGKPSRRIK